MATVLSKQEKIQAEASMTKVASGGYTPEWIEWNRTQSERRVYLYLPSGELTNPRIQGFVWAWGMRHAAYVMKGVESDSHPATKGMNAHGLEGFVRVRTTLGCALLVLRAVGVDRVGIEMLGETA